MTDKPKFERLILSAILIDSGIHSDVIPQIKPDYFATDRDVAVKIAEMYHAGKAIDTYTLIAELPARMTDILEISTLVASSANVHEYIARLKDEYLRGQIIKRFGVELGISDDPVDYLNGKVDELSLLRDSIGYHDSQASRKLTRVDFDGIIRHARINTSQDIDKPPTILSIKEIGFGGVDFKRIFTLGNFSCLIGKAKSRKTFLMTMLTSALLNGNASDKLIGTMPEGKRMILYFDTEQGEYDCYNTVKRIERMAGTADNLKGYSLRQYTPFERCQIIEHAFQLWGNEVGFCAIDGIADLANAINDEDEATRVSTMLLRLTKVYQCHICTVIHQNKNDNFATGHLGSAIMKKAEILISATKTKNRDISEINCDLSRGIDFEPFGITVGHDGLPYIIGLQKGADYMTTNDVSRDESPF
jgi:hypothetical protein